jgi:hypothetical protein
MICFTYVSGLRRRNEKVHCSLVLTTLYLHQQVSLTIGVELYTFEAEILRLSVCVFSGLYKRVQFLYFTQLLRTST